MTAPISHLRNATVVVVAAAAAAAAAVAAAAAEDNVAKHLGIAVANLHAPQTMELLHLLNHITSHNFSKATDWEVSEHAVKYLRSLPGYQSRSKTKIGNFIEFYSYLARNLGES